MSTEISLKETEKKVFRSAYQDGLIDIFLGCYFLGFIISLHLSTILGDFWSSVILLPFWALIFVVLWWVRKNVIQPRIGMVKYGPWRVRRMMRFNVLMVVLLTFSAVLGLLSLIQFESIPGWMHTARFALILLVGFSLAAYFLDFNRLYLYGVLTALAPVIGELLYTFLKFPHHGFPVTFGVVSAVITLTGVILLVRLLRDHPLPSDETELPELMG